MGSQPKPKVLKHFLGFVLACLLAFSFQIYFLSPISPESLQFYPPPSASKLPKNNILQRVIRLGDGLLVKPEDVDVDKEGTLYTATRDGWIRRLHKNGTWQNWKKLNGEVLGITITKDDDLIACDAEQGLLKITQNSVTVLTSHVNGSKISLADDVIEASDGSLYFSVASTKFGVPTWYLDVLEAKPHGQLLKYDPSSGETSIVLDNLAFANGVAVSKDQHFLVVCETWKFRCLRHWLMGENKGKTDIFIENLPGGPDNINLAPDGSFWIALLQLTREGLEFVHTSKVAKRLIAGSGRLTSFVIGVHGKAMVVKVTADGKILKKFEDPNGSVMPFVTSALEFEDHLYLGSLETNFIGKLPLKDA